MPRHKIASRRYKEIKKTETPAEAIERSKIEGQKRKVIAREVRNERLTRHYQVLVNKLRQPKYRALYIAIARLFADQLIKDIRTLHQIQSLEPTTVPLELMKKISLAGKWAPTPGASHDRVTNIATTISHIIHASHVITPYPSALNGPISPHERSVILRSFYQRWVLTELRQISACPESLMATNRWIEIKYSRVPSICMNKNRTVFFSHDPNGFEKYMVKVESGRKPISGAAMLPHELVAQIMALKSRTESKFSKMPAVVEVRKALAEINTRVIEAQWKTLIESLREAGSLDNCIAVCDVSGSMGSIIDRGYKKSDYVAPILPAVSLSLVLATLAKPPFNAGFISFSARPEFVRINLKASLADQVNSIVRGPMGFNTNFKAVFINLLLPLAVNNKIKQEDMVKRLFVFSDMQFDESEETSVFSDMQCDESEGTQKSWETTYDLIEDAYKKAGYEVPQIVFWDLNASSRPKTVEVKSDRKGVAMMNGFSPALLKVFMGEREEEVEVSEWEEVSADGTVTVNVEKEEFNPINVMKKVLLGKSFDGLVVVD